MVPISQLTEKATLFKSNSTSPLKKKDWNQHFTPVEICELMMKRIPISDAGTVVDLSVGKGELLWHARTKWPACRVIGFDIDQELVDHCNNRFNGYGTFKCFDTLRTNLPDILEALNSNSHSRPINLALSNPPFGITKAEELAPDLLDTLLTHNLLWGDDNGMSRVLIETAFFLRNLELIDNGGYVAILLPEGVISGVKTESFRRFLLKYTQVRFVLSLPINSFDSSEARISLVITQKNASKIGRPPKIQLGSINDTIESIQTVDISQKELISRMDPRYHIRMAYLQKMGNNFEPLGNRLDSCTRGHGFYGKERNLLIHDGSLEYIHSTDIRDFIVKKSSRRLIVHSKVGKKYRKALIRKGNILLVRVGKGCAGRCAIVTRQRNAFASDCLYVLSTKLIDSYYLCLYLNTIFAKEYFDACTRGVCSRYITKADLIAMPLYLPEKKIIKRLSKSLRDVLGLKKSSRVSEAKLTNALALVNELDTLINEAIKSGDCTDDPS